jgi:hypothetical protein
MTRSLLAAALALLSALPTAGCCNLMPWGCSKESRRDTEDYYNVQRRRSAHEQLNRPGLYDEDYVLPGPGDDGGDLPPRGRAPARDGPERRADRTGPTEPTAPEPPVSRPFAPGSSSNR